MKGFESRFVIKRKPARMHAGFRTFYGADDGIRTREYQLGKLGPYRLATPACVGMIIAH